MLTPILFTLAIIGGLTLMLKLNPTYKRKQLTIHNTITNTTSTMTIEQDVEKQLMDMLTSVGLCVVDEEIIER